MKGLRVSVVMMRVFFEGWLVVRVVFEVMEVFVFQCQTIFRYQGHKQVQAPQKWFQVFWKF